VCEGDDEYYYQIAESAEWFPKNFEYLWSKLDMEVDIEELDELHDIGILNALVFLMYGRTGDDPIFAITDMRRRRRIISVDKVLQRWLDQHNYEGFGFDVCDEDPLENPVIGDSRTLIINFID
jgi:hypothetical protein